MLCWVKGSRHKRLQYCKIHLVEIQRTGKSVIEGKRISGCQRLREGRMGGTPQGVQAFLLGAMKLFRN